MQHDDVTAGVTDDSELKSWHILLGVLAALMLAAVLHVVILSRRADRRLQALRAAGHPTSLAELALRNKLPLGMDNAAPLYGAPSPPSCGRRMTRICPTSARPRTDTPGGPWPEPVAGAIAECLAANEKCLALLHEAAAIENCRYDYDYRTGYPRFKELRGCVQLLNLAAIDHAQKGDADAAIACIKDGLRLGDSLQKEPAMMPYLMHNACIGVISRALERALSRRLSRTRSCGTLTTRWPRRTAGSI